MRDNVVLVCGLPGTGKSTYVKERLAEGLVYDLDALAGAFRARGPHEERNEIARTTANLMLMNFLSVARDLAPVVYVIRSSPGMNELRSIGPRRVVVCTKRYVKRPYDSYIKQRLRDIIAYCEDKAIPIEYIPGESDNDQLFRTASAH